MEKHMLEAIHNSSFRMITLRRMERLMWHDMVEWADESMLMPTQEGQQTTKCYANIQELRLKHVKVFSDIPLGRPPNRAIEYIIELEEGSESVMITPYQHPK